jgi:hypothetical protein
MLKIETDRLNVKMIIIALLTPENEVKTLKQLSCAASLLIDAPKFITRRLTYLN